MSLRMNLYGWSLPSFLQTLGSKDSTVLATATARLTDTLQEPSRAKAKAWLQTLIENGHPCAKIAKRRSPPTGAY